MLFTGCASCHQLQNRGGRGLVELRITPPPPAGKAWGGRGLVELLLSPPPLLPGCGQQAKPGCGGNTSPTVHRFGTVRPFATSCATLTPFLFIPEISTNQHYSSSCHPMHLVLTVPPVPICTQVRGTGTIEYALGQPRSAPGVLTLPVRRNGSQGFIQYPLLFHFISFNFYFYHFHFYLFL